MLDVVFVVGAWPMVPVLVPVVLVEFAGVPVALPRHGLRPPVGPDAELGVAEPVGILVLLEQLVGGLEFPCGDGEVGDGGRFGVLRVRIGRMPASVPSKRRGKSSSSSDSWGFEAERLMLRNSIGVRSNNACEARAERVCGRAR